MALPKNKDMFETETCGRCGGSGRYSFNTMDGDRCYGCQGSGIRFTKKGRAALEAWRSEYRIEKLATEIVPGDRIIWVDHLRKCKRFILTVEGSGPDELNAGQNRWNLKFGAKAVIGGLGLFESSKVELATSNEDKRAAYERIADMPGALGWPV